MRTLNAKTQATVRWFDESHTILHLVITGPRGGHRGGIYVSVNDLLAELDRLSVWESIGIPIKLGEADTKNGTIYPQH